MGDATVSRWVQAGRLHRLFPGVYAVGHRKLGDEGWLAAALLYAGKGAALSHDVAAWWWAMVDRQPSAIDISAPGFPLVPACQ
jgi:predicted transcriptional regulator of viral defense system